MKNILILSVLCMIFFSCKKERTIRITATNVATGERIPNLHYYIVQLTEGLNGEKATTVREGDLNANGEANVTMKLKKTTHVVRVVEPENNCYTENISLTFGPTDFNADFKFAPCGYLKINYENVNCTGPDDIMNFRRKTNYLEFDGWTYDRLGCYSYYSPSFFEYQSGQIIHELRVTRSGVTTYVYDTTLLNAGEYKTINLFY